MSAFWQLERVSWGPLRGPQLLHDLSVSLPAGRLVAVLGPNGSGKTCLLNVLAGLARPTAGLLRVGGESTSTWREPEWARRVAFLQATRDAAVALSVEDVLLSARFARTGRWPEVGERLESAVLDHLLEWELTTVSGLGAFLERSYATLSDGERQLVSLIRVLAQGTPAVVLDEPLSFLDVRHRLLVQRTLRQRVEQGGTVVYSLHDLETEGGSLGDVLVLHQGRVVGEGGPLDVLTPELVGRVWGVGWRWQGGRGWATLDEALPRTGIEPARTLPSGGF